MAPMSIPAIESSSEPAYTGPGAPPPVATANAAKTATAAIPMPGRARQSDASRVFLIDSSPSELVGEGEAAPAGPRPGVRLSLWRAPAVPGRSGPSGGPRSGPGWAGSAIAARMRRGRARARGARRTPHARWRGCAGSAHGPAARGDPRTHAVGDPHERPCDGVAGEREGDLEQEAGQECRLDQGSQRRRAGVQEAFDVLRYDVERGGEKREREPCGRGMGCRPGA